MVGVCGSFSRGAMMAEQRQAPLQPPVGKLGVLMPGMGAVATTFMAGIELHKRGLGDLFGSLTQLQHLRLGKRYEGRRCPIRELVPLEAAEDLVFGGWDIFPDSAWKAAATARVLPPERLEPIRAALEAIRPEPGIYDERYLPRLRGTHIKTGTKMECARQVMRDIEDFRQKHSLERVVMIWCGSTEILPPDSPVHHDLDALERGLEQDAPEIPPSMIYAYAAIKLGIPYANGAPNLSADIPALEELATRTKAPIAGKDLKTGQTLMKTILAPGFKARMLGLEGWYSTNILGNRDGEVLDHPDAFRTKELSKLSVLDSILEPELHPKLYGNYVHKVRIDHYPPRGDAKEGWDNIDIFGWLGLPMQIKINFLCRDSILAAPLVLDLALFLDLAQRAGLAGIQEWLSFYFKHPQCRRDLAPEHDLFTQHLKLQNTLRLLAGEGVLDHAGLDYYDPVRGARPATEPPRPQKDVASGDEERAE